MQSTISKIEVAKNLNKEHFSKKQHISGESLFDFTEKVDNLMKAWTQSDDFSELVWLLPLVETNTVSKNELIEKKVSPETIEILYQRSHITEPFAHDPILSRNHPMIHKITYVTCIYMMHLLHYGSELLLRTNKHRVEKLEKHNNDFDMITRTEILDLIW